MVQPSAVWNSTVSPGTTRAGAFLAGASAGAAGEGAAGPPAAAGGGAGGAAFRLGERAGDDFAGLKPQRHFARGVGGVARGVDDVLELAFGGDAPEGAPDGARVGLFGVRRARDLADEGDRAFAFVHEGEDTLVGDLVELAPDITD